ncbi:protease [Streptomyces ruber]|uniref:Protease n=3 Tax=Streptomyces TaxID=1883 RepID=A0A918BF19_9ACTN|nr:protease [Streptomyces ruber]
MVTQAVAGEPAVPAPPPASTARTVADTASGLVSRLGDDRTAGSWIDADGRPVVAVTDEAAAAEVESAGARARMVRYSGADLDAAAGRLRAAPRVTGTSWSVDPSSNEVVVRADSTVSAADWSRLTRTAEEIGGAVRTERAEGTYTTRLGGGGPVFSAGGRCSVGFDVTDGRDDFLLTAGHCGPTGSVWFADTQGGGPIGRTVTSRFPGADFSLVRYDEGQRDTASDVVLVGGGRGVRITSAADPAVGLRVFRSGSTSGLREGEVTGLDATVNYPEGTVTGLIETTVCAEPGDSGGPLFADGVALGVTSGGNGDCASGGTTFFQPVTEALGALGVRLAGQPDGAGAGASGGAPPAAGPQGATPPGDTRPGTAGRTDAPGRVSTVLARLTDPRAVGPGLLIIAGSLVALAATRYVRTEQERQRYRRQYSRIWG